jgi:SRSO17 transposase
VRADEVAQVQPDLDVFVGEVFVSLARKDQRAKGSLYLQGLMLEKRRKSMQPMGERLGIDYQQLQQFVSSSPWPVEPVRKATRCEPSRKAATDRHHRRHHSQSSLICPAVISATG